MKLRPKGVAILSLALAFSGPAQIAAAGPTPGVTKLTPADLGTIRGANYRAAGAANTTDFWRHYDAAETERDLGYANRLALNQVRVFVNDASWRQDPAAFTRNVADLLRTAARHGIGVMVTIGDSQSFIGRNREIDGGEISEFAGALVAALGHEPGLAFWDASNEPDYNASGSPADQPSKRLEIARHFAATFRKLDPATPVTIGMAYETNMEAFADAVDVLSFHDYLPTRAAISNDIARAQAFAASRGKLVLDTETGCIARANPYDVTLEEHQRAHLGWYVWELMITRRWGDVHGIFYPDGTVRDPAIPAAIMGWFRNRSSAALPELPDREGAVSRAITNARAWVASDGANWGQGLDIAETMANLIESAQLAPDRQLPTRALAELRAGATNSAALRSLLADYINVVRPYQRKIDPAKAP